MSTVTPEGITNPPIDDLLEKVDSKYRLVLFAAKRARQINAYYSQLGEGLLENVGPLIEVDHQEKPLSIALREVEAGVLEFHEIDPEAEAAARTAAEAHPDFTLNFAAGTDFDAEVVDLDFAPDISFVDDTPVVGDELI